MYLQEKFWAFVISVCTQNVKLKKGVSYGLCEICVYSNTNSPEHNSQLFLNFALAS